MRTHKEHRHHLSFTRVVLTPVLATSTGAQTRPVATAAAAAAVMFCVLFTCCTGVTKAGADAPLLRHLFAAAAQPVLHSMRSWAFLPDTHAAEAAAEATAMASFTAGSSSNPHSTSSMGGLLAGDTTSASAPGGPFAAAALGCGTAATHPGGVAGVRVTAGGSHSRAWAGSKAAEAAMRQCLQQAWHSVCARLPGCPNFLAHIQGPAGVAGMQLHLLQLLGGPGQALAERLGWLAELEQQEFLEVVAPHSAAAAGPRQPPAAAAGFMGLLCDRGIGGLGASASMGPNGQSLMCNLSMQQLKQVRGAACSPCVVCKHHARCCLI